MMSLFICHMEVDLKSVVIGCCAIYTTAVHHSFWGGICIRSMFPHIHARNWLLKKRSAASTRRCWRTVKEFPRVELPSDLRSATSCIEVGCMMSYFLWGGGKSYRHQPREALYTLLYLVHMIAVCPVVGRIAAILLYMHCLTGTKMHEIAFGHYLIAYSYWCCMRGHRSRPIIGATWVRERYSRQVQLVWESSDAGVIVKYLLGHTSLLLISWHSRAIFKMVTSTLSPQQLTLHWFWHIGGWKMHVLDNSTRSSMWSCREQ